MFCGKKDKSKSVGFGSSNFGGSSFGKPSKFGIGDDSDDDKFMMGGRGKSTFTGFKPYKIYTGSDKANDAQAAREQERLNQ